jgi:Cytochrome bd terminal oxidase subunit I
MLDAPNVTRVQWRDRWTRSPSHFLPGRARLLGSGAPVHLLGWYHNGQVKYGIEIPHLLSLLAYHSGNARVQGLDAVPADQRPPVKRGPGLVSDDGGDRSVPGTDRGGVCRSVDPSQTTSQVGPVLPGTRAEPPPARGHDAAPLAPTSSRRPSLPREKGASLTVELGSMLRGPDQRRHVGLRPAMQRTLRQPVPPSSRRRRQPSSQP